MSDCNQIKKALTEKYSVATETEKMRMFQMILTERKRLGLPIPERFKGTYSNRE